MAAPPPDLKYTSEEEKKKLEKEISAKITRSKSILEKAKMCLCSKNLESMIKRHVVKMHLAEYRNGHVQEYPEKDIIQEVVANHEHLDQDFGNENHEAILDEIIGRMEEKEVVLDLDEETEMNIFCKEFLNVDYEEYEEALKITKKGKILILKRRINERFVCLFVCLGGRQGATD